MKPEADKEFLELISRLTTEQKQQLAEKIRELLKSAENQK